MQRVLIVGQSRRLRIQSLAASSRPRTACHVLRSPRQVDSILATLDPAAVSAQNVGHDPVQN